MIPKDFHPFLFKQKYVEKSKISFNVSIKIRLKEAHIIN